MGVTRLGAGIGSGPLLFALGEPHYRRSEESWEDAGRPSALVSVAATDDEIAVEISSRAGRNFAARAEQNPMDNEHPDINSDGVQLYLSSADPACARRYGWLLVPENDGTDVRVSERLREGPPLTISATWTSADDGYILLARISLDAVGGANAKELLCQVVVNLLPHGRERRGGQLVLSGGAGEWIYLRGDRENPDGFLHLTLSA